MKQLEFDFEALPEVVKEIKKVVSTSVPRLSMAEVRECFWQEQEFGFGSRIYHICREQAKQELKDIEAGQAFASPRYKKMLKSY